MGKFKSQALAERLSRQYGQSIAYSVYPFYPDLVAHELGSGLYTRAIQGLVIGCVDNTAARQQIAASMTLGNWWLDAGNGRNSGQILIGDAANTEGLLGSFDKDSREVHHLPLPSLQLPSILYPPVQEIRKQLDCAEAVAADEQSPLINQQMASLVLEFVHRFLEGTLGWMAAYIDLEAGTMQTVPADPVTIARMLSVKVDTLYWEFKCSLGPRYSTRRQR